MMYTIPLSDNKFRKLKSQLQSRLYSEERQGLTDDGDTFSLPQNIRVMVSNYQLGNVHKIFAISESEYHTRELKTDEQFSPTVTIVDTTTRQPLDCVLLLHGEKPPEVSCWTLFLLYSSKVSEFK